MSFDYLNNLFGKFRRGRKTKFSDVEAKAKSSLRDVYRGGISYDEFYESFSDVLNEFSDLCDNVIDQDTPLWINMFGGNVFLRWRNWYLLRKLYAEHPEKFSEPETETRYREIEAMNYDEWLKSKIKVCLEGLN